MFRKNKNYQKGAVSILFSIVILSVLLIISFSIFVIMLQQIKLSGQASRSVLSFYAAETGAERCLYQIRINSNSGCDAPGGGTITGTLDNTSQYRTTFNGSDEIISIGEYADTRRKIRLTW